jgi:hypothetical protein
MVESLMGLYLLSLSHDAYIELIKPPPVVKVEKLEVDPKLYYPDLTEDMWDPNWINKKG